MSTTLQQTAKFIKMANTQYIIAIAALFAVIVLPAALTGIIVTYVKWRLKK